MSPKRRKIVHILYSGLGGHGNVFFSMVDADKEKAYEYAAIFMGIEEVREEYIQRCTERSITYHAIKKNIGFDTGALRKVYRYLRKAKPDIVFLHTPITILPVIFYRWSRFFRAKIIVRETQPNHLKTRFEKMAYRLAVIFAQRIIFLTEQFRNDQRKRTPFFFSKRKSRVIPNGIDLSIFRPGPTVSFEKQPLLIGMQGRLSGTKDHLSLIRAFALLKDKPYFQTLMLYIAGDGSMREELESETRKLELSQKIKFLGMLKEQDLAAFLQSLGLYIHASQGETMSTAIMQVMASRLPVIASDVFGINNMIQHGQNGWLVPVKDPQAIANAVDELYHNNELRNQLAETGYQYASEYFSNAQMWKAYKKEFEYC